MELKKSYFNKGLYLSTLKRFWPMWFVYLFSLIIALPVGSIGSYPTIYEVTVGVINSAWGGGLFISFFAAIGSVLCIFGFLYSPKQTGLIASLPINRTAIFTSCLCAAFTAITVSNILTFLFALIVELLVGMLELSYLLKWLAIITLMNITFFGFAAFCAMLTSNLVVLPIIYFLLSLTASAVDVVGRELVCDLIFGLSLYSTFLTYLSPVVALTTHSPTVHYAVETGLEYPIIIVPKELWIMLGIYSIIGVVFIFIALYLFKKHRMETSTDVIAIDILKPIFKYCMTFGVSLVFTSWMYALFFDGYYSRNGLIVLILMSVIGAIIGYFASLMMINKNLNVFKGKKLGLYISCIVIICTLTVFKMDVFGLESKLPDVNNVETASIYIGGVNANLKETKNIQETIDIQKIILDNKDEYTKDIRNTAASVIRFSYTLKDGSTFERRYEICYMDDGQLPEPLLSKSEALINTSEAKIDRTKTDFNIDEDSICEAYINYYSAKNDQYESLYLSEEEFKDLYTNAILKDIENGNLGSAWINPYGDVYKSMYAVDISYDVYPNKDAISEYVYLSISKDAVNTLNWIINNTNITPITLPQTNHIGKG